MGVCVLYAARPYALPLNDLQSTVFMYSIYALKLVAIPLKGCDGNCGHGRK